jgi:DNA-binding winged helix-turn-helix (wHTH) protein/tetratricopeptide (TPR) repeat protein
VAWVFGDCELSIERRELRRDGTLVPVEPQVFDVLVHLLAHRERVVTKNELLDEVWGDRFVSESALSSRIKSVRRALGDTGRDQRIIRTVHGRGFRFVADVLDTDGGGAGGANGGPTGGDGDVPADVPANGSATGSATGSASGPRWAASPGSGGPGDPVALRTGEIIDRLATGRGSALRIEGGSRATRTDALHALADAARARGVAVGLALPSLTDGSAFASLAGAFDEMTQRRPALLDGMPASCRIELQQVFRTGLPTTRQRWLVAVRELLAVAAEASGALLLVDNADHASPETLALVDDVARFSRAHPVAVVVAGRPPSRPDGWSGDAPAWFEVVTLPGELHSTPRVVDLPADVRTALRHVALAGDQFDELELRAAAGVDEAVAHRMIELALEGGVIEAEGGAFRLAPGLDGATATAGIADHQRPPILERTARRLADLGAPPARVAERFLSADRPAHAGPHALDAARQAAAVQLHRDVLRWTDVARGHVAGGAEAERLELRADALGAVGDPGAVAAYRAALAAGDPARSGKLRARLARAALYANDVESAQDALAGIEPEAADDPAVLHVRGMLAYYVGDIDAAEEAVAQARAMALGAGTAKGVLDAITLQGMLAHNRGDWFDRLRRELRATSEDSALASTVFDSHLCVAEFLLYGPTPYAEVLELAGRLRAQAEHIGARPAAAFATLVVGEAALLAGDLASAEHHLAEAIREHTDMGADTGTSHALQRMAELRLVTGDRAEAEALLRRALVLARWSPLAHHLLQRIYGTLIAAAPDQRAALAAVEEAVEVSDQRNSCGICHVMIAVPAAIACAEAGRLDEARTWLAQAEVSAAYWHGTAWQAAVKEARAHLVLAEGDPDDARRLLTEAAGLFDAAGQPLDAQRCRESVETLTTA